MKKKKRSRSPSQTVALKTSKIITIFVSVFFVTFMKYFRRLSPAFCRKLSGHVLHITETIQKKNNKITEGAHFVESLV